MAHHNNIPELYNPDPLFDKEEAKAELMHTCNVMNFKGGVGQLAV